MAIATPQVRFDAAGARGDQRPLELRDGGKDRRDLFEDPVAAAIVAAIEKPQTDPATLELLDDAQRAAALRDIRSILATTTSPGRTAASSFSSSGRRPSGVEPETPASV
jgi:hypothetical protein